MSPQRDVGWHDTRCIAAYEGLRVGPENALALTPRGMTIDRARRTVCGKCADACPASALEIVGKEWNAEELVAELLKDRVFTKRPVAVSPLADHANVAAIARFVRDELPTVGRWDLLVYANLGKSKYHRLDLAYALENATPFTRDEMKSQGRGAAEIAPVAR